MAEMGTRLPPPLAALALVALVLGCKEAAKTPPAQGPAELTISAYIDGKRITVDPALVDERKRKLLQQHYGDHIELDGSAFDAYGRLWQNFWTEMITPEQWEALPGDDKARITTALEELADSLGVDLDLELLP